MWQPIDWSVCCGVERVLTEDNLLTQKTKYKIKLYNYQINPTEILFNQGQLLLFFIYLFIFGLILLNQVYSIILF